MNTSILNIHFSKHPVLKIVPALLVMLAIFLFSARPSDNLSLSLVERILYKGGHVLGYALLSLAYWRAFNFRNKTQWVAWLMAVLYAATDEYHQSFVPGRHPSYFDVFCYDTLGALSSLLLVSLWLKQKQPDSQNLVADQNFDR
jgi:VanZ family protein